MPLVVLVSEDVSVYARFQRFLNIINTCVIKVHKRSEYWKSQGNCKEDRVTYLSIARLVALHLRASLGHVIGICSPSHLYASFGH